MYSDALNYLLRNNSKIRTKIVIDYLKQQLDLPMTEREVPYLTFLLSLPDNMNVLKQYLKKYTFNPAELSVQPKLTLLEVECPVSKQPICIDDGLCYYTQSGHFDYLKDLSILKKLNSTKCPVTRSEFKWIVKLSDLSEAQYQALQSIQNFSKDPLAQQPLTDVSRLARDWDVHYKSHHIYNDCQMTLLYKLCITTAGLKALDIILKNISRKIPDHAWLTTTTHNDDYLGETPLYALCASERGRAFLLDQPVSFFQNIPPEAWTIRITTRRFDKGSTAFNALCITESGHQILAKQTNTFFYQLPISAWQFAYTEDGEYKNEMPIFSLCRTTSGLSILNKLSSQTMHRIPLSAWTTKAPNEETPLAWLCQTEIGEKILNKHKDIFAPLLPQTVSPTLFSSQSNRTETLHKKSCCILL